MSLTSIRPIVSSRRTTYSSLGEHKTRLPWRSLDPLIIFPSLGLFVLGAFMVHSSSKVSLDSSLVQRQILFGLIGIALMLLVSLVDFSKIYNLAPLFYVVGILALTLVLTGLGSEHKGSKAWFDIGSFQIQPSEFMKLALILALAMFISLHRGKLNFQSLRFQGLVAAIFISALPFFLIMAQPDIGTVLIYGVITIVMLVTGGVRKHHLVLLAAATILFLAVILNSGVLADYQEQRLEAFINPSSQSLDSYTQTQAQIAIGNGSFTGQGFGNGSQTRGQFVPEQHTDFIFTTIGEELGFLGGFTTIALFGILLSRIWYISRFSRDMFEMLVCVGVMAMILFQVFESIGMSIGIMPITGIPLPFVSYGGSSMLTSFMSMGLIMSMKRHSNMF